MRGRHRKMFLPCCSQWQRRAEDNSLVFIRLFYRPFQQLWQLQPWSSLACFHYIPCKLWHLISLREMGFERWGTRVAKSSSPRCLIYCTWAAGREKCFFVSGPLLLFVPLHCLSGRQKWTCFFHLYFQLFLITWGLVQNMTTVAVCLICDHITLFCCCRGPKKNLCSVGLSRFGI